MKEIIDLWTNFLNSQNDNINKGANLIVSALENGHKLLIAGNGGSASQASHFTAEVMGRFEKDIKPYPAISLSSDISVITAISNDFSFENLFSYQIEGIGDEGDVFIALTTSGKSENIIKAVKKAKEKKLKVISLLGKKKSILEDISDVSIKVPGEKTARIQEIHLYILHKFAEEIDARLR